MKTELSITAQKIRPMILELKDELKKLYGDNMVQLILFGSYARGDIHDESDIDLLLVLKNMESPYQENVFMNELKYELSLKHEKYFSVIATTMEKFSHEKNPLYDNVNHDGILIWKEQLNYI